jgi:flagellar hook-basal body complex protein FliE
MVMPAAAAAAYRATANIAAPSAASTAAGDSSFGDFLSNAIKDSIGNLKQGEQMAAKQVTGQANMVDVVNAVNQAEITLDTVVAIRDKVITAYQSIMQMPI